MATCAISSWAEVTVLIGSTFSRVVLRQTEDMKKVNGNRGSYGRRHNEHFEVRVESLGTSFDFN